MRGAAVLVVGGVLASSPAHADQTEPFDAETMSLQAVGGLVTGSVLGLGLGLAGAGIGQLLDTGGWGGPLAGAVLGVAIGGTVGLVGGVDYVGDRQGANGSGLGTMLGFAGGLAVLGSFQYLAFRTRWRVPVPVQVVIGLTTVLGGPIVGYHLTADRGGDRKVSIPIVGFVF